jgi:hypothetical protein
MSRLATLNRTLKACPFCGSREGVPRLERKPADVAGWSAQGWMVTCGGCIVSTNDYLDPEHAVRRWNNRLAEALS